MLQFYSGLFAEWRALSFARATFIQKQSKMVKVLLVVGGNPNINWYEVFKGAKLHGKEDIVVEMTMWDEFHLVSYSDSGVVLDVLPASTVIHESQRSRRTVQPNFLLIRSANRYQYCIIIPHFHCIFLYPNRSYVV